MKKTMLITGATDGIGKQTALELAATGATVIIHGRSEERCRKTIADIHHSVPDATLEYIVADLSSLKAVRGMGQEIVHRFGQLHVLLHNAGIFMNHRSVTPDGFEATFAVNHLAPFVLTQSVLDVLKQSSPARIITVSSIAHSRGKIDFNDLQSEKRFGGYAAYAMSKLANIYFTTELSSRLKGTGVTANCLHPGVVRTKLLITGFGEMSGSESMSEGAETSVYLSTAPEVETLSGLYFVRKRPHAVSSSASNPLIGKKLWEVSERLTAI